MSSDVIVHLKCLLLELVQAAAFEAQSLGHAYLASTKCSEAAAQLGYNEAALRALKFEVWAAAVIHVFARVWFAVMLWFCCSKHSSIQHSVKSVSLFAPGPPITTTAMLCAANTRCVCALRRSMARLQHPYDSVGSRL